MAGLGSGVRGVWDRAKLAVLRLLDRWNLTRVGRAITWYSRRSGAVMAGGIAYSALFSLFAALVIAWNALRAVLGADSPLTTAILDTVRTVLPGVLSGDGESGILDVDELSAPLSTGSELASIVAGVVLLVSALTFLVRVQSALRAMLGIPKPTGAVVADKLRELATGVAMGILVVVIGAVTAVLGALAAWFWELLGFSSALATELLSAAAAWILDAAVIAVMIRLLAGARPARRDLLVGAAAIGLAMAITQFAGTAIVGGIDDNPLLAAFGAVATLLAWVNVVARVILFGAAWIAQPMLDDEQYPPPRALAVEPDGEESEGSVPDLQAPRAARSAGRRRLRRGSRLARVRALRRRRLRARDLDR